jgi:hypothetical protein
MLGGQPAAMACHDGVVGGGDEGHEEAERAQTGGDLRDLLVGVLSQVAGVGGQAVTANELDRLGQEGIREGRIGSRTDRGAAGAGLFGHECLQEQARTVRASV